MIAYLDASCLAMLILHDPGNVTLEQWIQDTAPTMSFSGFGWGELVSAVSFRVRRHMIDIDQARSILLESAGFVIDWSRLGVCADDIAAATDIVARFDLKLRMPDALHVALARRIEATLVTSDRRQADAAIALEVPVFNPLAGASL